jgi:hypothetical protein
MLSCATSSSLVELNPAPPFHESRGMIAAVRKCGTLGAGSRMRHAICNAADDRSVPSSRSKRSERIFSAKLNEKSGQKDSDKIQYQNGVGHGSAVSE